jgi:cysteinyl-tRNA synthetase
LVKSENKKEDIKATLLKMDEVLGLELDKKAEVEQIPAEITKLAEDRLKAKAEKNWAEADRLREEIKQKGFVIEDGGENGYKLKKQ